MGWFLDGKQLGSGISEDEKGSPSGVATLDGSGMLVESETNELARNRVYIVADAAERLALTPKEGHECVQLDDSSQWIYDDVVGWIERTGGGGFDHNDTNNKQGGTGGEYYHLTNAQHSALTGGSDASSIHHHDGRYHIQANSPRLYTNAGNPNGSVTPGKVGDQCFDTTNKILYYATDTTNSGWVWA